MNEKEKKSKEIATEPCTVGTKGKEGTKEKKKKKKGIKSKRYISNRVKIISRRFDSQCSTPSPNEDNTDSRRIFVWWAVAVISAIIEIRRAENQSAQYTLHNYNASKKSKFNSGKKDISTKFVRSRS